MKKILLLFILISAIPFKLIAGSNDSVLKTTVTQWMNNSNGLRFLENKGQLMDMQRKPVPNVLYEASGGGMDIYVTTSGLSYVFVKLEKHKKKNSSPVHFKDHNDSITETYCRADMQLIGASIKKENIIQEGESADRSDYYYGDVCPNGILGVHSYSKVTIKNIYPGIDWVLHTGKQGLKYDFIVHAGADPSQIKLKYKWTDKPQLQDDGSVKISTPMGNITEGTPLSYCNGKQVPTTYTIKDSEIHFNVSDYNSTQTLIIDPKLVWATYYGGNDGGEMAYFIQSDGTSVWVTGSTGSQNFPTLNPGGGTYFQGTLGLLQNVFILQFNIAGVLKWATYYGGGEEDMGLCINSDGKNVWVTGTTTSKDFPTMNPGGGAYFQGTLASGQNAFILQFNTSGVRKWATYYGGSITEISWSIQSDRKSVWVTGWTESSDFPTLNPGGGAYFQGTIAGNKNAFILQFTTAGVRKWATYYGGSNNGINPDGDEAFCINSDGKNVWVTGVATSFDFPTLNPGGGAYYQGVLTNKYANAFILQFNTAGVRKWATYYGGNAYYSYDQANSINSDGTNVWVTGFTGSPNFPTYNPGGGAYYQGALAGTATTAFILQFNTSGVRKWATYYGGSNGSYGSSIQCDGANLWVLGYTASKDFPKFNPGCGFYQDTLGPDTTKLYSGAAFIAQFSTTGVQKWSTYYGTGIGGFGGNVWSDGTYVFLAVIASLPEYPTVNPGGGAYYLDSLQSIHLGLGENAIIAKFTAGSGIAVSPADSICPGDTIMLHASGGAASYSWTPANGLSATNIPNPLASPSVTTTYTLIAIDTGTCAATYIDSVKVILRIIPSHIIVSKDTSICKGSSIILRASGGISYTWSTGATTNSIFISNDKSTQTYTVGISNGCVKDTTVKVAVLPIPGIYLSGNKRICPGGNILLQASGGISYKWSNGYTGSTYNGIIDSTTTIRVIAYNSFGCSHDTSVTIVPEVPALNACCNATITAGNDTTLVAKGNTTKPYQWSPHVTCINPPACDSVKVSPTVTTTYTVAITDSLGCLAERIVTINVELPCSDFVVPNVFTPDYPGLLGVNNVFYIQTSILSDWSIIIYDRWGREMFSTTNLNQYWDGSSESRSKAPDGVYYYIINATCRGTPYKKDGFVQLIR